MAKGGVRPGAGRKPGVPNKVTAQRQAEVAASGETPLDYMLKVMRDPSAEYSRRDDMAKAAAPYVHPKLSSVDSNVKLGADDDMKAFLARIAQNGRAIHDRSE